MSCEPETAGAPVPGGAGAAAERVMGALNEVVRAAQQWSLYGPEHPVTKRTCGAAAEALVAAISGRPHLTLTVIEAGLLVEGEPLPDQASLRQLHAELRQRQVAALTIRPGIAWEEISALIGVLATDPAQLQDCGGVRQALQQRGCEHIEITEVDYSRFVPAAQAQFLSAFSGAPGGISSVVEGLVGTCLELAGERLRLAQKKPGAERGIPMPFPLPQLADEEAAADDAALQQQVGALQDISPEDYLAVGLAWLIQASGEALREASPQARRAWREAVSRHVAQLDLALQARIFRAPRQAGSRGPDLLPLLVADRSPEQIADLILARPAAVIGEPSAPLERILRRTLSDERKLLAVAPLLRERLVARGMSQDSFRNVVGLLLDQIATDMAMRVEGGVGWLGDFDHLPAARGETVEQWPDLLQSISPPAVAKSRAQVLLAMLHYDHDPAAYLDVVGCIEKSAVERAAAGDVAAVLEAVQALAREVDREHPARSPIAAAALQRLGTAQVARIMSKALAAAPPERQRELVAALGRMGNECVEILLEQGEKAEDPQLRALALRCLAQAGERGAAAARHLLAHGTLDQVVSAAAALAEGRQEHLVGLLAAGFEHRQAAVRMCLAEMLGRVGGLTSEQLLIRALYDEDARVQAQAAKSLGEMRARGAVHALSMVARKGALHGRILEVRKAAVQALGKIGAAEAVPTLREILNKRSVLFRERAQELSALAAIALQGIADPEAQQALAESSRAREAARPGPGRVGLPSPARGGRGHARSTAQPVAQGRNARE